MDVNLFDFDLPENAIAVRPVQPRHSSKLLHVSQERGFKTHRFLDLADLLNPGDCLVVNNTKVIPARLRGKRGEAGIEITLHQQIGPTSWKVFARPAKKARIGDRLCFEGLDAEVTGIGERGERLVEFDVDPGDMMPALIKAGDIPLPPYIESKRHVDAQDSEDYQTVYAKDEGAVAAPTAGLHFTDEVFKRLETRGIGVETVTLHVGAGTFLPVTAADTDNHKMHEEWGTVSIDVATRLNSVRANGGRIVAVGTTSLRLLESAVSETGVMQPFTDTTDIFITPGYRFKAVDALITNFHLPKSTLMMLVSAFAGFDKMHAAYKHAIESGYRFYSYGDSSLLERADETAIPAEIAKAEAALAANTITHEE